MGVRLVFYFILLAATSIEAGVAICNEKCGAVAIQFPFGMRSGCYGNSWFRVTCNEAADGPKPFISRINLELLGSDDWSVKVTVSNPVAYFNCGNKGNNGTTSPASVNLKGTPFFFSSRYNVLGSVGCGNFATFFGNNHTDPIGGCLQQRCGDLTSKSRACCAEIDEHDQSLTFYTATMLDIIYPGKKEYSKRCTSAFMLDRNWCNPYSLLNPYPAYEPAQTIGIDTTHVPAKLEWNPVECDLKATLCQKVGQLAEPPQPYQMPLPYKSGCSERCGNVDIPFPFGINERCYKNKWFRVTCNETTDGPRPFISSINVQLLNVSFFEGTVLINNSITYLNCLSKDRENNGVSVNLTGSPFSFSQINIFASVGCGSLAIILRSPTDDHPVGGCQQPPCGNIVTSIVSCSTNIPSDLSSFAANMTQIYPSNGSKRSCGSAFIVDERFLKSLETINSGRNDTSNRAHVPTTLQWGTPKRGLCTSSEGSNTSCSSDCQYCWTSLSRMHLCICSLDSSDLYDYHSTDVCEEIGKCWNFHYNYCFMLCLNAPGNNCLSCPDGYEYSSSKNTCKPMNSTSPPEFLTKKSEKSHKLPITVGFSTSTGTIFLLLGTWHLYKVLETRKNIKLKQKYFKRNGGLLLQQQLSSNEGNVEKIKLFGSKELEKATDYYNENRILGQGGQGTVYKGMLTDGSIVAIKKSKMVEVKKLDETKLEQFMNEVIILSQINHRNVVKLLGCCLETEVPLLVYEFIPNGTLYQFIHEPNEEFPLTWEMRLRIAIETANALSYLHSAASVPIYHREIKSSNILLDDKYRAKMSDFGTSRLVALEQTHVTTRVQGTFGYLDPEYFRSNQFTEKSDVYSFGVVLVELLTGQKPVSSGQSEEIVRSLVSFFLVSMKENSLFDILDQMVLKEGPEEEIVAFAKLAKRCLNLNGKKRPTMKQVAIELEWIRSSEETNAVQQSADEDSDIDDMIEPSASASCSMSTSITSNSVTLPVDA